MVTVEQQEQESLTQESIKIERNTKGYNWSVRVVIRAGEDEDQALARLAYIDGELRREYGARMA